MTEEQINELAEKWCVENMDCCKIDNTRNEETPYFSDEERCIAKSAHADGIREGISIACVAIEKSKSDISESVTKAILDVLQKDR